MGAALMTLREPYAHARRSRATEPMRGRRMARQQPRVANPLALLQDSPASWRGVVDRQHERRRTRPDARRRIFGAGQIPNARLLTPDVLDVRERPNPTLAFLRRVRGEARRRRVVDGFRRPAEFELNIQAAPCESMCLASALMLLAERDRSAQTAGRTITFAGKRDASPPNLGLLLDATAGTPDAMWGHVADGEEFLPLLERLHALPEIGEVVQAMRLYDGLMDAALNSVEHAYPEWALLCRPQALPKWWAAAAYDPSQRCMQICVYDQGVGIPATIARDPYYADFVRDAHSDADKIELAITFAEEGRAVDGKGRGLSRMLALTGEQPFASAWILSGSGQVSRGWRTGVVKDRLSVGIDGTLVLWHLFL